VRDGDKADRPLPAAWRGGRHSLVDQLCLDISPQAYESERAFWSALTCWERRPGSRRGLVGWVRRPQGGANNLTAQDSNLVTEHDDLNDQVLLPTA
jgi:hypothetical protein